MTLMNNVYVRADGCVRLGSSVTCDGFCPDTKVRIQSHVHHDHLKDLERSKGHQLKIACTRETYELLCAEFDADLPFRRSQWAILPVDGKYRSVIESEPVEIAFYPSGHMIGSVISSVRYKDGVEYVYTSDFSWPLHNLPNRPDVLVVDATYGDPSNVRRYNENQVIEELLDFVRSRWAKGSILFSGYRGRLQYALQLISDMIAGPILVSRHVFDTLKVYMNYQNFNVDTHLLGSPEALDIIQSNERFLCFVEARDRTDIFSMRPIAATNIFLSAFMVPREEPLVTLSNDLTRVAFTDHADFFGTIELIRAISPRHIIADGTRGGNADVLANYVVSELDIPACSRVIPTSNEWGHH